VRNYLFYQHYPYKPSSSDLSTVSCLFIVTSLRSYCYHACLLVGWLASYARCDFSKTKFQLS